jgi:hypothetical protein
VYLQNDTDDPVGSRNVVWDLVRCTPDPWYYVPLVAKAAGMSPIGGTWATGLQLRNLSTSNTANVSLSFYWAVGTAQEGQLAAIHTAAIAAGSAQGWYIPSGIPTLPQGSLAISSDSRWRPT